MSQHQSTSKPLFQLATWNVGGPQHSKWCEFVTEATLDIHGAMDELFADPASLVNTTPALVGFRHARRMLMNRLARFFPDSLTEGSGAVTCPAHDLWVSSMTDLSVAQAFLRFKDNDKHRAYSWGDRAFPDRPTVISASPALDPALFKATSHHGPNPVPQFRRFEEAWMEYMLRATPKGELLKPMPVNKYMMEDPKILLGPSDVQITNYLDVFYFDWCLTLCAHCFLSNAVYPSFWRVRESVIRNATPIVRRAHTAKFIASLVARCSVVALQEMSCEQMDNILLQSMAKIIMPDQTSDQMACLVVSNALTLRGWDIFKDYWSPSNHLSARVAGCVIRVTAPALPRVVHGDWIVVSAHCTPSSVESVMEAMHKVRRDKFPSVVAMVLMGDLNYQRAELHKLGQVCAQNGFQSTWNPFVPVPNTVNNVRSVYFQTQQAKGGKANCAPKDHVLMWSVDNLIPRTNTSVVTSENYTMCRPTEELRLALPSDHAPVIACAAAPCNFLEQ